MAETDDSTQPVRRLPTRTRSNFAARTARDEDERLYRRSFAQQPSPQDENTPLLANAEAAVSYLDSTRHWLQKTFRFHPLHPAKPSTPHGGRQRPGAIPRPVGGVGKLGTFAGVFVPVTLNVLSILMFLRFGFILGQAGLVGIMGMLIASYLINLVTTMSISAIATNGTVRGGGPYYLVSRSLGPEFGGSIGIVYYLGSVFNTSLNAVGLVDCLTVNFGHNGAMGQWLPQSYWWQFLWATIVLAACTLVCLAGSGLFARASNGLLIVLLVAIVSIPLSVAIQAPFVDTREHVVFTGFSMETFRGNLLPNFTKGAAGSAIKGHESFQNLFGILFPATGGILAGASMSGDLKHPSKAIPKGTLYGLGLTFALYTLVIFALATSISRETFYGNINVIQLTNVSGVVILLGELSTSLFSVLMGVIGSAKLLQALARDHLIPGLSLFSQGNRKSDEPINAIFITFMIAQITMFADINKIASFITMTYLMTFLVTNLACFLLKLGSAPNFRPSFHFFNLQTAATGTLACGATMFFVDGVYASGCVALLMAIFLLIHYTTPPKPWGDVSQGLIYHQVRKYLLRLRQEHVKFWRPQILLLVNDPRRQYKLIQFCNSLKKGGLFVLGHVIVSQNFAEAVPEARQQQQSWTRYIDFSKIKAFVNIAISPTVEWGARNLVLGAGLGGMRPNIVIMGFYNLPELRQSQPLTNIPSPQPSRPSSKATNHSVSRNAIQAATRQRQTGNTQGILPTDAMKPEDAIGIKSYVEIVQDLVSRLQTNVAIAKGFQELELPSLKSTKNQRAPSMVGLTTSETGNSTKAYIDLWPIQMSAEVAEHESHKNVLTTNFDTYTLILQLGCILHTVPSWKRMYKLRVCVFVEYETDVEEERDRVTTLLKNLRIEAKILVFWLASGGLKMYEVIVNGKDDDDHDQTARDVDFSLEDECWWQDIKRLRQPAEISASQELAHATDILEAITQWPTATFQHGRRRTRPKRFSELQKLLRKARSRVSLGNLNAIDATNGMRDHGSPADLDSDNDSYQSSNGKGDDADDEAVVSESEALISGSNFDEYDLDASSDESVEDRHQRPSMASKKGKNTTSEARSLFLARKPDLRMAIWKDSQGSSHGSLSTQERPTSRSITPLRSQSGTFVSEPSHLRSGQRAKKVRSMASSSSLLSSSSYARALVHPSVLPEQSSPKFTSNPTPHAAIASEEAPGPSITFVDSPIPASSLYTNSPASGFPAQQAIPLSFNDLPCRAQHLILNELIRQQSADTAVVFTTLPSPMEGTCDSESESVKYISDLEVLCQGLPPVLLVHSNSMTVTMNL